MLEVMMALDFGSFRLPCGIEIADKNYVMGIAHRNRDAADLVESQLDGEYVSDLRLTHGYFEFVLVFAAGRERTGFETSAGSHQNAFFCLLRREISSYTASAISRNFGFRTVGVEQAGAHVSIWGGKQPFHAIGTDTLMTVAHLATEIRQVGWGIEPINDEEIISAGAGFDKRNNRAGRGHSGYTGPNETASCRTDEV